MSLSVNQFLLLYSWFPLVAIFTFMLLIARFFEEFSGKRTFFRFFLLPIIFFGIGIVRYASMLQLHGDTFADLILGIAGIVLLLLSGRMYWLMIIKR